ncbi:MAG TPA: MlaD family protein, partial [Methylomirabilota bacterium]|nr:MlaD family protein [Methylomirabilota bacterium]
MSDGHRLALQIRIGGFILIGLGVFLAIIYLLGAQARYFERKQELVAEFTEVGGLLEGATVRLAGVQIGRVTRVQLPPQPGGKVRVTLTIARRFADRIRRNSEARIVTQGLLGDKLVEITVGSPDSPPVKAGDVLATREPFEMAQMFAAGADTLAQVNQLATTLRKTVDRVDRMTEEVEKGKGWLHVLIYEEPESLRRLNALLTSTQQLLTRAEGADSAVGVLLSKDSGKAARSLLAAMDALGRAAEKPGPSDGLLPTLLFDPEYKGVARDLQVLTRNFRDVSEKLAHGQGLLGELLKGDDASLGQTATDFRVAMANLKAVTDRLKAGEGTVGALLEDPTVYENLVEFLEGARRSFLLRSLIRSTID